MFDRNHRVVLGIDLWEHGKTNDLKEKARDFLVGLAYYPVYENRRNEYVEKFWQIINWSFVDQLYTKNISDHREL